jgi:hypothetical protein
LASARGFPSFSNASSWDSAPGSSHIFAFARKTVSKLLD